MGVVLIGELEFNEKHYHVDGRATFLFMGYNPESSRNKGQGETYFNMSPYPEYNASHVGNNFVMKEGMTLVEFLKWFVATDEYLGRSSNGGSVVKSLSKCKVRLKGMEEWISRKEDIKEPLTS